MIGGPQIILIVIVVLLLFGGRKIPELMKGLGSGIKEFKKATKEEEKEEEKDTSKKKKVKENYFVDIKNKQDSIQGLNEHRNQKLNDALMKRLLK